MDPRSARPPLREAASAERWLEERAHGLIDLAVLAAALELGLPALLRRPTPLDDLARAIGVDSSRLRPLLAALRWQGLVATGEAGYALTPRGVQELTDPSPLTHSLAVFQNLAGSWLRLAAALRGEPAPAAPPWPAWGDPPRRPLFEERTRAVADATAEALLAELPALRAGPARLVDLGCGTGAFTRALLERCPRLRATLVDRAPVVDRALGWLEEAGLAGRLDAWRGDLHDLAHPVAGGEADLVLVSNLLHSYGPEDCARILSKAAACARPGGALAVRDLRADETGDAPRVGVDFALVSAMLGSPGGVHDPSRILTWLAEAGLKAARELDHPPWTGCFLIVARREGRGTP